MSWFVPEESPLREWRLVYDHQVIRETDQILSLSVRSTVGSCSIGNGWRGYDDDDAAATYCTYSSDVP